jgi:CBS domain-containing protein
MIPPKEFIRKISPFSFLSEEELNCLIAELEVDLYPKGTQIFEKGQQRSHVYMIYSGLVGLFDGETPLDYYSRGEIFGALIFQGERYLLTARAVEETVCYLMPASSFREVLNRNERFSSFFTSFMGRKLRSFRSVAKDKRLFKEATLHLSIEGMISRDPVICREEATVYEAVARMEHEHVSSIVVTDDQIRPLGIMTQADLRRVVLHGNRDDKVTAFMSKPVVTISASSTIFDALAQLARTGIKYLVLVRAGQVVGVITRRDLEVQLEPTTSVFALHRGIIKATTLEQLSILFSKIHSAIAMLALLELNFYDVSRLVTAVHDRIVTKVIQLTRGRIRMENALWIHMGSSGRKEQIIAADQDNALITSSQESQEPRKSQESPPWAEAVTESLHGMGMLRCPGAYMASNPMWNRPLADWEEYFASWFENPEPNHVRYLSVFLDTRPVYGNLDLYRQLTDTIRERITSKAIRLLASDAVQIEPPLGMFGIISRHKEVDLKTYGIYPIVNGVRVLAVEQGLVDVTNTKDRLDALLAGGMIEAALHNDLLEAFGVIQDLRLRQHAKAILNHSKPDSKIRSKELAGVDLLVLKESLKVVASFQKMLMKKYNVARAAYYS